MIIYEYYSENNVCNMSKICTTFLDRPFKPLAARRSGYTSSLVYIEGSFNSKPLTGVLAWPCGLQIFTFIPVIGWLNNNMRNNLDCL